MLRTELTRELHTRPCDAGLNHRHAAKLSSSRALSGHGHQPSTRSRLARTWPGGVARIRSDSSSNVGERPAGAGVRDSGRLLRRPSRGNGHSSGRERGALASSERAQRGHGWFAGPASPVRRTWRAKTVSASGETANRVAARSSAPGEMVCCMPALRHGLNRGGKPALRAHARARDDAGSAETRARRRLLAAVVGQRRGQRGGRGVGGGAAAAGGYDHQGSPAGLGRVGGGLPAVAAGIAAGGSARRPARPGGADVAGAAHPGCRRNRDRRSGRRPPRQRLGARRRRALPRQRTGSLRQRIPVGAAVARPEGPAAQGQRQPVRGGGTSSPSA